MAGAAYHDYAALTLRLHELAASRCRSILRLFSLGRSVEGRELWAVRLTDRPEEEEDEPEVLYAANIHGDETLGRELLLRLVLDCCARYAAGDARVRRLVDETDVYVVFSLNPDGYEAATRYNRNGQDLNRNFPDQVRGPPQKLQPETQAVLRFLQAHSFSLGANLHAGTLVCNYPWDDRSSGADGSYVSSISPDDALYRHLCGVYSHAHPQMHLSQVFPGGITNGAAYFSIYGGLQDYAYSQKGMLHVTLELGYTKAPAASRLEEEWRGNAPALYGFLEQVHRGVRGTVRCVCSGGGRAWPANASLTFAPLALPRLPGPVPLAQAMSTRTDPARGDFHRVLLPGAYLVTARGCGAEALRRVEVPAGAAARADFALRTGCPGPLAALRQWQEPTAPLAAAGAGSCAAAAAAAAALLAALGLLAWRRGCRAAARTGTAFAACPAPPPLLEA